MGDGREKSSFLLRSLSLARVMKYTKAHLWPYKTGLSCAGQESLATTGPPPQAADTSRSQLSRVVSARSETDRGAAEREGRHTTRTRKRKRRSSEEAGSRVCLTRQPAQLSREAEHVDLAANQCTHWLLGCSTPRDGGGVRQVLRAREHVQTHRPCDHPSVSTKTQGSQGECTSHKYLMKAHRTAEI